MDTVRVRLEGDSPLIMHNGQLADPLHPIVKQMKEINAKKSKKTDEDLEQLARLEWFGSLYLDDEDSETPVIGLPEHVLMGAIRDGARETRRGKDVESSVAIAEDFVPLEYDGPTDLETLFQNPKFRDARLVRVQANRILRTRPVFRKWAVEFNVRYNKSKINRKDLISWIEAGGLSKGIGDFRPRFGRFSVKVAA